MRGTYFLIIYFSEDTRVTVGSLGNITFNIGYYIYVGSAMGEKGSSSLEHRIRRHLSNPKKKNIHWHIDYLLEKPAIIIGVILIPTTMRLECLIAQELCKTSIHIVPRFGSSDCSCKSHLFYFKEYTGLRSLFELQQK